MTDLAYQVFDVDNHYYETADCFTRYIEPAGVATGDAPPDGVGRVLRRQDHRGGAAGLHQPGARLKVMDGQGVEAAVLLPTMALTVEHHMRHDVDQTYTSLHVFNRWLDDEWGFAYEGRIYASPLLSLSTSIGP